MSIPIRCVSVWATQPCSFTWLQDTDAKRVGSAIGDSAPAVVVVPPPQDRSAPIFARLAAPRPRHGQPEIGVGVGPVHSGAGAQPQQLLPPLQRAFTGESHQVFELALALAVRLYSSWLEVPSDRSGDARVMARLDQTQEIKGVSERYGRRPR